MSEKDTAIVVSKVAKRRREWKQLYHSPWKIQRYTSFCHETEDGACAGQTTSGRAAVNCVTVIQVSIMSPVDWKEFQMSESAVANYNPNMWFWHDSWVKFKSTALPVGGLSRWITNDMHDNLTPWLPCWKSAVGMPALQ